MGYPGPPVADFAQLWEALHGGKVTYRSELMDGERGGLFLRVR